MFRSYMLIAFLGMAIHGIHAVAEEPLPLVHYEFELSNAETERLIVALKSVKPGESVAEVKSILGKPTGEQELFGKKGEFNFTVLEYYIKQVDIKNSNIHDQLVSLYFDQGGRLIRISKSLD